MKEEKDKEKDWNSKWAYNLVRIAFQNQVIEFYGHPTEEFKCAKIMFLTTISFVETCKINQHDNDVM